MTTAAVLLAALAPAGLYAVACQGRSQNESNESAQGEVAQGTRKPTRRTPREIPRGALVGQGDSGDWTTDAPGVRRRITTADLPKPYATRSVDAGSRVVPRPAGALPNVGAGFKVEEYAAGLQNPRLVRTAPNGDLFVAESYAGRVRVLRGVDASGKAQAVETFATGLRQPFGIAFYPPGPDPRYVYVANTDSVVRFAYAPGDMKARGAAEVIVPDLPGGGRLRGGGHWTRDVAFSPDGRRMFVSVGSLTNVYEDASAEEENRADILSYNPDGTGFRMFATGIRNAVGLAVHPRTGELWCSVNERDGLGDDLVPDYITRVREGGFYGWPWYYIGPNQDPRHEGARPELRSKVVVPDVLVQSHSASLEMVFYTGAQFPREYAGDAFAAFHGSWNRSTKTGFKVVRVPLKDGTPTGEYEDFMTGFVTDAGDVWGRPVGVAVGKDGALFVSDDGSNTIWRVSYTGGEK
jgi:glucose/arabinose dehydrogenase